MAGSMWLADSNILIRLVKRDHPDYQLVRGSVSAMDAHGLTHILTFNGADFSRFAGLTAIHPSEWESASTEPIC
jgi:predicted nucleic acid-binding protein